ncbi:GNAT family N-acetyltransferase [Ferrimonas balearica]|uniref:GNAT family N-acetyltransferase n=1 Tax=Ferrimonas balearica TaxID=44012 RepID=UPI001C98F00A|nr:GNAT family N-acetyltransferase [Ferrimonas balearica]MBY5922549.1 GNAT family N-acetyltransferase [Ferrimonas balearica]MBY5995533.1 GNAT family N-acetyltransferase [Ferrimonas balearica]
MSSALMGAGRFNHHLQKRLDPEIQIRPATVADIPELSRIRLAVVENVLADPGRIPPELYETFLTERGRGWVALCGGTAAGFAVADGEDASIWALFVDPPFEGQGLGKALLERATDWLFANGARVITLSTEVGTRAEGFYLAQGWHPGAIDVRGERHFTLSAPE